MPADRYSLAWDRPGDVRRIVRGGLGYGRRVRPLWHGRRVGSGRRPLVPKGGGMLARAVKRARALPKAVVVPAGWPPPR